MKTSDKYSAFSRKYDKIESMLPMKNLKKEAIGMLQGKILEVGIGSGANLRFYTNEMDVTGIDFSSGMLEIAKEKIEALDLKNIHLFQMDVENMDFPDNQFDSVISTCVFCTVPNPKKGMAEIYRVLKPGGKAVFLEHMKSQSKAINFFLWILTKIIYPLTGTSFLRETENYIREAGFSNIESKNVMMVDVVRLIVAKK